MTSASWRRLFRAAAVALLLHAVAGASMLLVLRRGLETEADLGARLRFLVDERGLWVAGWVPWNLAALSMLWLCVSFVRAHHGVGRVAIAVVGVAVALDLSAEAIEMFRLPELAAVDARDAFLAAHRRAVLLTGFAANGLYTLCVWLLAARTRGEYPAAVNLAAAVVVVAGAALSLGALAGSVEVMVASNVVLVPALLAWLLGIGVDAARRSAIPARRQE